MKIRTDYEVKPIPIRTHDWSAIDYETYDGQESDPIGYGATEIAAIRDLLDQIEMQMDDN